MLGRWFPFVVLSMLGGLVIGCSPEGKARRSLETYETVFRACKQETEKSQMKPGEHGCSAIASSALDLGLDQTGVDASKKQELLTQWLEKKQFVGYYVPADKRSK
jgi:hypothetical protein